MALIQTFKVAESVLLDFEYFFDGIIDEVYDKYEFTRHNKVIHRGHITKQFQGPELEERYTTSGGRVLQDQPNI